VSAKTYLTNIWLEYRKGRMTPLLKGNCLKVKLNKGFYPIETLALEKQIPHNKKPDVPLTWGPAGETGPFNIK